MSDRPDRRRRTQVFLANGTWFRPDTTTAVDVRVVGGGGGGGTTANVGIGAGGGGGGWAFEREGVPVSGDVSVIVGAGGAGGVATQRLATVTLTSSLATFTDAAVTTADVGKLLYHATGFAAGTTVQSVSGITVTASTVALISGSNTVAYLYGAQGASGGASSFGAISAYGGGGGGGDGNGSGLPSGPSGGGPGSSETNQTYSATWTNGSPVVTGSWVQPRHIGMCVTCATSTVAPRSVLNATGSSGEPTIVSVVPGVSFTMNQNAVVVAGPLTLNCTLIATSAGGGGGGSGGGAGGADGWPGSQQDLAGGGLGAPGRSSSIDYQSVGGGGSGTGGSATPGQAILGNSASSNILDGVQDGLGGYVGIDTVHPGGGGGSWSAGSGVNNVGNAGVGVSGGLGGWSSGASTQQSAAANSGCGGGGGITGTTATFSSMVSGGNGGSGYVVVSWWE